MTAPQKHDLARGWLFAQSLLIDDEVERLEHMTDGQVLAEMGIDAAHVPSAEAMMEKARAAAAVRATAPLPAAKKGALARTSGGAVVPLASAAQAWRVPRLGWLMAAAFAVLAAFAFTKQDEIVAIFRGHPASPPVPQQVPRPPDPSPLEPATVARADAQKACAVGRWLACSDKLDEAKEIDPAGDDAPSVVEMRKAIVNGLRRDNGLESKPRPRQ